MSLEVLNRYVLIIIGLLAVLVYIVMIAVGFSELISRMPKAKGQCKRYKAAARRRAKKST